MKYSISHQFNQISLSNLIRHFDLDVHEDESSIFTTSDHRVFPKNQTLHLYDLEMQDSSEVQQHLAPVSKLLT